MRKKKGGEKRKGGGKYVNCLIKVIEKKSAKFTSSLFNYSRREKKRRGRGGLF